MNGVLLLVAEQTVITVIAMLLVLLATIGFAIGFSQLRKHVETKAVKMGEVWPIKKRPYISFWKATMLLAISVIFHMVGFSILLD